MGPGAWQSPPAPGEGTGGPGTAHVVVGKVPFEGEREEIWDGNQAGGLSLLISARGFAPPGAFLDGQSLRGGRGTRGNKAPFRKFINFFVCLFVFNGKR